MFELPQQLFHFIHSSCQNLQRNEIKNILLLTYESFIFVIRLIKSLFGWSLLNSCLQRMILGQWSNSKTISVRIWFRINYLRSWLLLGNVSAALCINSISGYSLRHRILNGLELFILRWCSIIVRSLVILLSLVVFHLKHFLPIEVLVGETHSLLIDLWKRGLCRIIFLVSVEPTLPVVFTNFTYCFF